MPLDYSKWKDIEVSDDEDDVHPNVDTPSLFRWRHQARLERMAEKKRKKNEIETQKNDFTKKLEIIDKKLQNVDIASDDKCKLEKERDEITKQMEHWHAKEAELAKEETMEKWNVDTIGKPAWSTTRINKISDKTTEPPKEPTEEDSKKMRDFFDKHESDIKKFAKLKGFNESQTFLLDKPHLCCEYTANYITLEALNEGILEKEAKLLNTARQCVTMQYLLELAKSLKAPSDSPTLIEGFFRKIKAAEDSYMRMFHSEVEAFVQRVHTRAAEKREEAVKEHEEEERQKRIAASPGGLDPAEVMQSLPQVMQDAFEAQDIPALQKAALDVPDFEVHLKRCIDSGLWVPGPSDDKAEAETEPTES